MQRFITSLTLFNRKIVNNDDGFVLVMSMLILAILVVIGISGTDNSITETNIARNDRFHKMAFYNSEAGVYATPKLISKSVDDSAVVTGADLGSMQYVSNDSNTVFRKIMGYTVTDTVTNDLTFTMAPGGINYTVNVDIARIGSSHVIGGGVEFATGYEGIGTGATGGVIVRYKESSTGSGPRTASSLIEAGYKKVVGVPGGL